MTYFSKERSSHIAPSPQPHPQNQKKSPENTVHFPIAIFICKHWPKFVTCSPSPRDCRGSKSFPRDIVIMVFDYAEQNGLSKNFDPLTLEKELSVGGGLGALQFFWSLKKGTRTFHFRYNEPSCDILGPLG